VIISSTNLINVFKPTEFTRLVHKAIELYEDGFFQDSAEIWEEVSRLNANYVMAHRGMGRNLSRFAS